MKSTLLATLAMLLYAAQNVVLEQKLSRYPVAVIMVLCYVVMLPLALARYGVLKFNGDATAFPTGSLLVLALIFGVVYFLADYCFFVAYASGGTIASVTTIAIMLPVFASLIKFAWVREFPNGWQIVGYIFAVAAIFLVGKGNS